MTNFVDTYLKPAAPTAVVVVLVILAVFRFGLGKKIITGSK